jgi:adenylate cyclase
MARIRLKRLVGRKKELSSIIINLSRRMNAPLAVKDADGHLLLGDDSENLPAQFPVEFEGEVLGWVMGGQQAADLAALLAYQASKEAEKKTLAEEVLDRYREVNLLYNISEKLAASLELESVVEVALEEASRLIAGSRGALMLADDTSGGLETASCFGHEEDKARHVEPGRGIFGSVAQSNKAEIINEVETDPRAGEDDHGICSLVCAPLSAKQKVMGVIFIGNEEPVTYTAADLKLLNTIASQAAPAIENALLYQKELKAAKEREARLQQQIKELRIELSEAKQQQKVAEITETDYFQGLLSQADDLRAIMDEEE